MAHGRVQPEPPSRQVVASHAGDSGIAQAHHVRTLSAARRGSSRSSSAGFPVSIWRNRIGGSLVTADPGRWLLGRRHSKMLKDSRHSHPNRVQPLAADQVLQLGITPGPMRARVLIRRLLGGVRLRTSSMAPALGGDTHNGDGRGV